MLDPLPTYPTAGAYVVQLHREASPETGVWIGRIEHVATGAHHEFTSGASLLAWLLKQSVNARPDSIDAT